VERKRWKVLALQTDGASFRPPSGSGWEARQAGR
jgi:hypothetical protein